MEKISKQVNYQVARYWCGLSIVYNKWVHLVQCLLKKGGIIVVPYVKSELISMRLVTSWQVCINYRKLNAWYENIIF